MYQSNRNFVSPDAGGEQPITVELDPWLLWQLTRQLDAQHIPYQTQGERRLTTMAVAQPLIDQVTAGQPRQPQPQFRSQPSLLALLVQLGALLAAIWAVLQVTGGGWADPVGPGPSTVRAVGVFAAGTFGSVIIARWIGRPPFGRDSRWMLVGGMTLLSACAAGLVWLVGQGVI